MNIDCGSSISGLWRIVYFTYMCCLSEGLQVLSLPFAHANESICDIFKAYVVFLGRWIVADFWRSNTFLHFFSFSFSHFPSFHPILLYFKKQSCSELWTKHSFSTHFTCTKLAWMLFFKWLLLSHKNYYWQFNWNHGQLCIETFSGTK